MTELDIYDPPSAKEPSVPKPAGYIRGILNDINDYSTNLRNEIDEKRRYCGDQEQKVLTTLKPVTRYVPVTYDTVKRISVIGLCTFSGVLQGRKRGRFRRYLYPVLGFIGGSSACYPQQTYQTTNKLLISALPLAVTAGKASVEVTKSGIQQGMKLSSFIYTKVKEQFPDKPLVNVVVKEEPPVEVAAPVLSAEQLSETSVSDEIAPTETSDESVEETVIASSSDVAITDVLEVSNTEVPSTDKIIPLDTLAVSGEVVRIQENLGMGDTEHDDMYSTRSARS